jgi:hypothetical protein
LIKFKLVVSAQPSLTSAGRDGRWQAVSMHVSKVAFK